jgi:ribosome-associated toxin RatA of RatAB toxin-antitoxin module
MAAITVLPGTKIDAAAQKGPYKLLENNWKTQANGIPG